jgi:hypothetical protein
MGRIRAELVATHTPMMAICGVLLASTVDDGFLGAVSQAWSG